MDDDLELEPKLRGTTLRVYWFLLQSGRSVGVREVQRSLNLSSPSVASHHLTKLERLSLVEKNTDNTYDLVRVVKVGVLRNFTMFRGVALPRFFFLAVLFTAFTVLYVILSFSAPPGLFDRVALIVLGVTGAIFTWVETYRLIKIKFF
ncbi:MAG: winged helix-turn-helix domain-containing protein [Candidatus Thorarchaeota archaeon]|nr:winged helix-turn-helix domain-containing protein [Candidatus Thorarchaeota archaeon]